MPRPERWWTKPVALVAATAAIVVLWGLPVQGDTVELPGLARTVWSEANGWEGVATPRQSLSIAVPPQLAATDAPDFRPPIVEFPPEEFSFSLVEYSTPIRVVENEMLFRFELPGVGRALVSCEFIF